MTFETPQSTGGRSDRRDATIFEEVLGQFASGHLLVYPLDIARESGRSPGSVYRECQRMDDGGWLQRAGVPGDKAYRAGPRLWGLLTAQIAGSTYEAQQATQTIAAASDSIREVARRLEHAVDTARHAGRRPAVPAHPTAQGDAP